MVYYSSFTDTSERLAELALESHIDDNALDICPICGTT